MFQHGAFKSRAVHATTSLQVRLPGTFKMACPAPSVVRLVANEPRILVVGYIPGFVGGISTVMAVEMSYNVISMELCTLLNGVSSVLTYNW